MGGGESGLRQSGKEEHSQLVVLVHSVCVHDRKRPEVLCQTELQWRWWDVQRGSFGPPGDVRYVYHCSFHDMSKFLASLGGHSTFIWDDNASHRDFDHASKQLRVTYEWICFADTHTLRIPKVHHHGKLSDVPGGNLLLHFISFTPHVLDPRADVSYISYWRYCSCKRQGSLSRVDGKRAVFLHLTGEGCVCFQAEG